MIIYLHGFNSAYDPTSEKIKSLEKIENVVGITYDTFADFSETYSDLSERVREIVVANRVEQTTLVGTSLGGYYTSLIGTRFGLPSVLINPAIDPSKSLRRYLGNVENNRKTGISGCLSESVVSSYRPLVPEEITNPTLVLLSANDPILSAEETTALFVGHTNSAVHKFDSDSHRFDKTDDALELISQFIVLTQTTY